MHSKPLKIESLKFKKVGTSGGIVMSYDFINGMVQKSTSASYTSGNLQLSSKSNE